MYKTDAYDDFAYQYADMVAARGEEAGIERVQGLSQFLNVIRNVTGLTVLDAGCGEGYIARLLARRGASVTGIDIAPRLLQIARMKDPDGKIEYREADLCKPLSEYERHFDLITSFFVLNDVHDYQGFLNTLGMVARSGGRLVMLINNPYSFVVRGHITDYFASGKAFPYRGMAEQGVKVHFYQRTLEEYLNAASVAGFQLQQLVDVPTPEGTFKRRSDTLIPEGFHFPFFMVLSFTKL